MNELIAETKAYLLENYSQSERIFTDKESYDYFVAFAMQQKTVTKPTPPKKVAPPIKPPPIIQARPRPKPAPKKIEAAAPSKKVEIVEPEKSVEIDHADLKKAFAKNFSNIAIIDTPPDDIIAKQRKKKEAQVVIVSSNDNSKQNAFLHHLANAIDRTFAPATVLSQDEIKDQNPKLFIGTNDALPDPKLIMQPISSYINDPQLKAKLWEQIQTHLA